MPIRPTLAALALAACAPLSLAGDTNPPTGPVAPTMKTLVEVEPRTIINDANTPGDADSVYKITAPGSYYLTANITGAASKHGIEIESDDVTIDLMGHTLTGVPGSLNGIFASVFPSKAIHIRNGSLVGWGANGLHIAFTRAARVRDVTASDNANFGFWLGHGTIATRCVASANTTGFTLQGASCVLTQCVATDSLGNGFASGDSNILSECTAVANDGVGIAVNNNSRVTNCVATDNGTIGISAGADGIVSGCIARNNGSFGISGSFRTIVLNNTSSFNDAAGVYLGSDGARAEGNHCNQNDKGVEVTGVDNYIVRNTCIDNTTANFDFGSNNRFGEIVDHTISSTAPFTGNSAPSSLGSTDPWANFAR